MEVPLLSQDEYLRHLDLQSVHAQAKFHYRHALKERLRASSIALRKDREENKTSLLEKKSQIVTEIASPCRLLSPSSSNRLFGRPVIRREKRTLDFDDATNKKPEYSICNGTSANKKPSILSPLIADSRVFRHPGIKRELEERSKLNGFPASVSLLNTIDYRPDKRSKIEARHCYYKTETQTNSPQKSQKDKRSKDHTVHIRVQPTVSMENVEKERRMAAALTLFGHPRKSDVFSLFYNGVGTSGKQSPILPHQTSTKVESKVNGNNNNHHHHLDRCKDTKVCQDRLIPTVQLEKLPIFHQNSNGSFAFRTDKDLQNIPRGSRPMLHRKAKEEPPPPTIPPAQEKPTVLMTKSSTPDVPSYRCPMCHKCFANNDSLMVHGEQAHLKWKFSGHSLNPFCKHDNEDVTNCCQSCQRKSHEQTVTPLNSKQHQQAALSTLELIEAAVKGDGKRDRSHKCDICSKMFDRKSRMIRHITNCHAADLHKVDLSKFAYTKKVIQSEM